MSRHKIIVTSMEAAITHPETPSDAARRPNSAKLAALRTDRPAAHLDYDIAVSFVAPLIVSDAFTP